jgi:hypothetical protein
VLPSANLIKLFFFVNDKKSGLFAPSEASLIFESKAGVHVRCGGLVQG